MGLRTKKGVSQIRQVLASMELEVAPGQHQRFMVSGGLGAYQVVQLTESWPGPALFPVAKGPGLELVQTLGKVKVSPPQVALLVVTDCKRGTRPRYKAKEPVLFQDTSVVMWPV